MADLVGLDGERRRQEAGVRVAGEEADRERHEALDRLVSRAKEEAARLLEAAGCHNHRGCWRRRKPMSRELAQAQTTASVPAFKVDNPRPGVRLLDQVVVEGLVPLGSARGRCLDEAYRYADELAGPDATPTERLLADTAATCWLALRREEALSRKAVGRSSAEYRTRQVGRHHRRLCATLRTLAQVRRLTSPRLQINVASQQVVNN